MGNRTIGTGISNNVPCAGCLGKSCPSSESCWHREYSLDGRDECKCFLEPGPTAGDGQPGTYPGWSGWERKTSTQSTNTIIISTNNGQQIPVDAGRIAEIRYVDENDNVNSIPFPGYGIAQEITNYVMDVNNIEPPPRIGLTTKISPPHYQTIIGAYACGTEGAKACRILCEDVVTNNQDFLQGCCNPSSDFPRYRCPSTNATTCYHVGLWNGDSTHPNESVLVNTTYVCASSPAEACPTCSTTGGGSNGGGSNPRDNTTTFGRCIQKRDRNGKQIKVCAPRTDPAQQQGQQ